MEEVEERGGIGEKGWKKWREEEQGWREGGGMEEVEKGGAGEEEKGERERGEEERRREEEMKMGGAGQPNVLNTYLHCR